jgi:archaellum biogenesis ATPase FlaH
VLEGKFLILDSVSTMLVYNSPEEIERLIHALIIKCRKWRMKTILLAIENAKQDKIVETISQFCDSVAKI